LPTLLVWAMSGLHFAIRGRGAGLWQSAFAFGQFLSPVVVTFAAAHAGGLQAAFVVLSYGALAGLLVVLAVAGRIGRGPHEARGLLHG